MLRNQLLTLLQKDFGLEFGTMTILDDVVTSLWECRNDEGLTDSWNICDPGFTGDSNYWGWAW